MSEKTFKAKWTGVDPIAVPGIHAIPINPEVVHDNSGRFLPNIEVEITEAQAEKIRGINSPLFLIDGKPSVEVPDESAEMGGKIPASKKAQAKDVAEELVDAGELPPQEKDITVKANLKKGKEK